MGDFARHVDDFLHGRGGFAIAARPERQIKWLIGFIFVFGILYGAVMGSFSSLAPGRGHQLAYSAVKVPLLLFVTFALCLPSFFVINTVLGLRADFRQALRAIVAMQSSVTIVLACLAPVTALFYLSVSNYSAAVLLNGLMFAIASMTSQIVVRRYYAPLIRRQPRHRVMLLIWFVLYIFVGIQMGWVLRPFIGAPNAPVVFFRQDAWGNAYVVIAELMANVLRGLAA